MSKISQELKVLLYLNDKINRSKWVSIKEIANYLEVSDRQSRRYLDDLSLINDIEIITKRGREGGYRLAKQLDKGFSLPENIVLALSIAMKHNDKLESVLSSLPNYVITESVSGDNYIDNDLLDNLEVILTAIKNQKEVSFMYQGLFSYVKPYKVYFTNKTYYLLCTDIKDNDKYKSLNISNTEDIKILGSFKQDKKILELIKNKTSNFGIKSGKQTTLRVKCNDLKALNIFDKYFEHKGIKDEDNLTYVVIGNSENELYYPLFRISTKSYIFLDEEFKNNYLRYLKNQIRSIEAKYL